MIKKHKLKGCCGSLVYLLETDKPLNKTHIEPFKQAKYSVPDVYVKANLLFVETKGLIAHGSFGSKRMQVKVNAKNKNEILDKFIVLLDKVIG